MINFRNQIKKQLKKQNLSIPAMARRLECHPQTLYDFLSGKKALGSDYLEMILNELNADLSFNSP